MRPASGPPWSAPRGGGELWTTPPGVDDRREAVSAQEDAGSSPLAPVPSAGTSISPSSSATSASTSASKPAPLFPGSPASDSSSSERSASPSAPSVSEGSVDTTTSVSSSSN